MQAEVQRILWFAVIGAGLPFLLFGLLLFQRVLSHRVYFRAWCHVTDIFRKEILKQYRWYSVPRLLIEEEGKTHRVTRSLSWHNTLLVIVAALNATLTGIVALAAFQADIMPHLPAGVVWLFGAGVAMASAQTVVAFTYHCIMAPQLLAKRYDQEAKTLVDVSAE
jgi:hypothetical protein